MKAFIIILITFFGFNYLPGQNNLNKGPFYKNAKAWKADKKKTDVYIFKNKVQIKNGLFVKNQKAPLTRYMETTKLALTPRRMIIRGPKAKNTNS